MDESLNLNEWSDEQKAILERFEAADLTDMVANPRESPVEQGASFEQGSGSQFDLLSSEDLLDIFVNEVDEDIKTLQRALRQFESAEQFEAALAMMRRTAHKLRGTTAAMGCTAMSTIASTIEMLMALIKAQAGETRAWASSASTAYVTACGQAIEALSRTLEGVVTDGQEDSAAAIELEEELKLLGVDVQTGSEFGSPPHPLDAMHRGPTMDEEIFLDEGLEAVSSPTSVRPSIRVDSRRFEQLLLHGEQLAGLHEQLENAQGQVDTALQELHAAQIRLSNLEAAFASHLATHNPGAAQGGTESDGGFKLSIIHELANGGRFAYQRVNAAPAQRLKIGRASAWDELEMEHFSESDILAHSLSEAIADVMTASSQLRVAFVLLKRILREYSEQSHNVRSTMLLLRKAPLNALLPSLEQAVGEEVEFELRGGMIEVEQDVLETLRYPLFHLMRSCLLANVGAPFVAPGGTGETEGHTGMRQQAWLYAREEGNEIILEVGFSLAVEGGGLKGMQEPLRRVRGSISVQRSAMGGVRFLLRLPRSLAVVQGLRARVGRDEILVPFSQVERIEDGRHLPSTLYTLSSLLDIPEESQAVGGTSIQPVLVLTGDGEQAAVQVDEVVGDAELVVKPLGRHLQRPGILGAAIDGMNRVLLVVDLPALIEHYWRQQSAEQAEKRPDFAQRHGSTQARQAQRTVLIADDSVFIRQSVLQVLRQGGYDAMEAHDGIEALNLLLGNPPDALLLDIEMPNLNGYDLLSIIQAYPELAKVKVIMLTSRSLEKHQQRARELGVEVYLTKPCAPEVLLETLKETLAPTG